MMEEYNYLINGVNYIEKNINSIDLKDTEGCGCAKIQCILEMRNSFIKVLEYKCKSLKRENKKNFKYFQSLCKEKINYINNLLIDLSESYNSIIDGVNSKNDMINDELNKYEIQKYLNNINRKYINGFKQYV